MIIPLLLNLILKGLSGYFFRKFILVLLMNGGSAHLICADPSFRKESHLLEHK